MFQNFPSPQISRTQNISRDQVNVTQPISLPLKIVVLRAHNLPLRGKRKFYAVVTYGTRTWKTRSVQSVGNHVEWNADVDSFAVQSRSRITISLHEKRTIRDILVGSQEITCEHQRELDIILGRANEYAEHTAEPTVPYLTIAMSANASSSTTAAAHTPGSSTANPEDPIAEGGAPPPTDQANSEAIEAPEGGADSQREVLRTLDCAEEAMDAVKTWKNAIDIIKRVMDTVNPILDLNPYAKLAWGILSKIPETLLNQFQRDDNIRTLLEAIRDAFEFSKEADILRNIQPASNQAKILDEMLQCVTRSAEFIESYAKDVQVGKRTWKNIGGQVDGKVEDYRTALARLREEFLAHATITIEATVLQTQVDVSQTRVDVGRVKAQLGDISNQALEAELDAKIREMPYNGGWRFGDERRCLPGTREAFLDYVVKWINSPESERALVLLGQAGMGKSSIAHEVARRFDNKYLGSYFTFVRKEQSKDEAYQLFTTLVRDLADHHPMFKLALGKVIKDNSSLRGTRDYRTLFESLLLEPLKDLHLPGPILIVVDALDESGVTTSRNGLHTFLAQRLIDLPPNFRILITSRPENGIEPAFANARSVRILYMDDPRLAANTEQDIGIYLQNQLPEDVFSNHGDKLAKAAEGLFQWAAVASGFINSPASLGLSMTKRVQRLLGHSRGRNGEGLLDNLYEEVLKEYIKSDEAQILFRSIMGQLLAAIDPLSIDSFIALRRHAPVDDPEDSDPALVLEILSHLGSLLSNVTSSDQTRPIVPLHTSFRDFLTNKTSNVFYVDLLDAHHQLAHSCLGLMLDNLKFNICKLESSYLANSEVADLESRIAEHIPSALSYACIHWDGHLEHLGFDHDIFKKLRSLFETKFLFWLEVLSIKSSVGLASPALSYLLKWLQQEGSQTEVKTLLTLVHDASSFVRYFGMTVARSAPHIYLSALPFAPSSSQVFNQYVRQFPRILTLERGRLSHWPALEMTIQNIGSALCVAFSPDGRRIASSSRIADMAIRVWDATTGLVVAGPFTGHRDSVNSIAFSPDGQRIASASNDCTVRVWDATTGQIVAGPFTGYTSVAFSPDGQHIASTSRDCTIRVCDATTGEVVAGPFTGHTMGVSSVTYSPDGRHIATASYDCTIRVWDAKTGEAVAGPFTGHIHPVRSVAFSPDGQLIASGSDDSMIRVWDAMTGEVVAGPFTGHTYLVTSVVFSPDGRHIASASVDFTTRVWNATTGQVIAGPFTAHTREVESVAFSPDGRRIASASNDCTIRVWDVTAGQVASPVTGHTDLVLSVEFSLDGQHITSVSRDGTIRVWDAISGQAIASPVSGHPDWIRFVAFSPDRRRIALTTEDLAIRVRDVTTGQVVAGPFTGHAAPIPCVAFSPDGQRIASASHDDSIRVWDATTGEVLVHSRFGNVQSLSFSPDGQRIAIAAYFAIRVCDATIGEVVAGPFTTLTSPVAFSPDGQRIASASHDRTIRVWDATTGQVVAGPFTGHTREVASVAFSPDGQRIASASKDWTIRVWDATTGQVAAGPFIGHTKSVSSVVFSPDGKRIASISEDCTIRVWDVTSRQVVGGLLTGHTDCVMPVSSSPDTQHTPSASDNFTIHGEKVVTEDAEKIHFTDQSLIHEDGWIYGEQNELVLWVPELHRPCLHRPSTVWIAGEHETRMDFSKFVHGSNWATVHHYDSSK